MKTKNLILAVCIIANCILLTANCFAQSPQAFKYQSIVRNASGNPMASVAVNVRATVHDGSATGTVVYLETFAATTNQFGLINLEIGNGTVVSGTFSSIAWGTGTKWMQIEADFGAGYLPMGTSQLLSVPYALYSGNGTPGPTGPTGANGTNGIDGATGATGSTGTNGIDGATGATGSTGTNGTNGTNGVDGATGSQGIAGVTGATGATGSVGATGATGAGAGATYRWASFHTYDNVTGWAFGDSASLFGGIHPSNWTDASALAYQMSPDKNVQRTLFQKKGYAKGNAMIFSDVYEAYSSTDGEVLTVMFRINNTTGSAIIWTPFFFYTAYSAWGETASITVNGANTWSSGTSGNTNVALSIPSGQVSTVIFVSPSGATVGSYVRACKLAFYNNCLTLPAGLIFVDDLDTATGGWGN